MAMARAATWMVRDFLIYSNYRQFIIVRLVPTFGLAFLTLAFCGAEAVAQSAAMPRTEAESKLDALTQKIEQLEKSNAVRWEALEKIRAADLKALDEKIDVKEKLSEVRKDVTANAQKSVDWWLAFFAVFLALVGFVVPFLLTRNLREQYEANRADIAHAKTEMQQVLAAAQGANADAQVAQAKVLNAQSAVESSHAESLALLDEIKKNKAESSRLLDAIKTVSESDIKPNAEGNSVEESAGFYAAVKVILEAPEAALATKLFAKGAAAFHSGNAADAVKFFAASDVEKPNSHETLCNWGLALGGLANLSEGDARQRLWLEEIGKYETALKIKPDSYDALFNWGVAIGEQANAAKGNMRQKLLLEEIDKYEAALQIKPNKHEAHHNWGAALSQLADALEGNARQTLKLEAITKYETALKLNPNSNKALCNWGIVLNQLADVAEDRASQTLRGAAIAKYEAAVRVKPDMNEAIYHWGLALGQLADAAGGDVRQTLRNEEITKYKAALKIKPDMSEAFHHWGIALSRLADDAEGDTQQKLRLEEITKYEAALQIKPNMHEALLNWGAALLKQAHVAQSKVMREYLLTLAEEKLLHCERITGAPSYNLACVAAARGNVVRFIELANALKTGDLPDKAHLDGDNDLDSIREMPEFQVWMNEKFCVA